MNVCNMSDVLKTLKVKIEAGALYFDDFLRLNT